ncbi:hypothetical protein [Methylobacterium sp. JK268]
MPTIRKQSTYDGRCSVFVGAALVISDLTEPEADALVAAFRRLAAAPSGERASA